MKVRKGGSKGIIGMYKTGKRRMKKRGKMRKMMQ